MSGLTTAHMVSIIATLSLVTAVGVYSGRRIKSAADFSLGGRRAGSVLVAATIMGTLVGGASTIGTAQLAFRYGLSAWWFTLGGGIACLILGLALAGPLRATENETMPELLGKAYGGYASVTASLFSSVGTFLNLVAQVLAAVALLTSMLALPAWAAALAAAGLMVAYVAFGGVWGTGLVGLAKLALLYGILLITGALAYTGLGGWEGLRATFPAHPWFSLLGRGAAADLAAGFSLLVGVLSTQTYIQAMFSARSIGAARSGALLAAFLIPPAGVPGILIGLFMRKNFPDLDPAQAFPAFVLRFLPAPLAGVALATLLVAVVGTGAGLALGISTMVTKDIYRRYFPGAAGADRSLLVSRLVIVAVTGLSLVVVLSGNLKSLILEWTYLSMGLRGATVCLPLLAALFWPGRIARPAGRLAVILGPLTAILWKVGGAAADPLYPGLLVSFLTLALGAFRTSPGAAGEVRRHRT
ncbi:sodium:solute symporter [Gelria sp. Kuro-4]|uniref:sodium:solute symporter family protein n=1 Tax=Gelria sp. Kuro-4 TaxID=2796927 RepID=UPI001BEE6803|nr:sodium:solute symporter family protein [Gelria sp. Kuro-4]BCV24503.1 sodium:solute symporter [Gelria sp. Kuro-4]